MKKALKIISFLLCSVVIIGVCSVIYMFLSVSNYKLDESKLLKSAQTFEFYSQNGDLIAEKSMVKGCDYITLNKLSENTKNAFIAIEDRRFYSHNGIDLKRMLGATLKNIKALSFKEGASTITQQLVKNTHLSNEKTLKRKFAEIKIALELERNFSKDKILELYLNTIYFGKGAYGIESASKTYFSKSASSLSLSESATLAGLIKAPSTYQPTENYNACLNRRNVVLKCMNECGYINNKTYESETKKPINVKIASEDNFVNDYINAVINEYESLYNFTPYGYGKVRLYTYLNPELQRELYSLKCEEYGTQKIVIDSKNNGVIAYYGNNSNLKRSPASCVKPWLVYAPCINDGFIKESSVLSDEPISFSGYSPKNYNGSYSGKVTARTALINSLNVPSVKLLNDYGIDKAERYANKFGISILNDGLPSSLGAISGGLTIKELCDVYSVFNSGGNYTKSSFIKCVYVNGLKTYEHMPISTPVFSEQTAFIVSDMLNVATLNGTSKKLRSLPFNVYAKTGTSGTENGNTDAISVSYTSDKIVGVWYYPTETEVMPNVVTGSNHPTVVSSEILSYIYKNSTPPPIKEPNGVIKKQIDTKTLLTEQRELICENGEPFYYLLGSEPTEYLSDYLVPSVENASIHLNGNEVTLNFIIKNCNKIDIYKENGGITTCIYSGEPKSLLVDKLDFGGIYNYKIIAHGYKTVEYNFNSVKYSKELDIIKNGTWFLD